MNRSLSTFVGLPLGLSLAMFITGCGGDGGTTPAQAGDHDHAGHSHEQGPHGGPVQVIQGADLHLEITQQCGKGVVGLWFLGSDAKTAVAAPQGVKLNIKTADGPLSLAAQPVAGKKGGLTVTDPRLASHDLKGQVVFTLAGKEYALPLPAHDHGHDHGTAEPGDHGHGAGGQHDHGDGHKHDGEGPHDHDQDMKAGKSDKAHKH